MDDSGQGGLILTADLHAAMLAHCRREYPLECCGLLAGHPPRAEALYPFRNELARESRYSAHPRDLLRTFVSLRTGQLLRRFEAKGLRIAALKLMQVDRALGERHYAEHRERAFFKTLIDFITGGPVIVGVLAGHEAVAVVRNLIGKTDGAEAHPGTI